MNALDYLLKANLYGLLFVGCYWLFLRRHTFFTLNRSYLLASAFLTLTLPLVTLPAPTVETLPVPVGVIALPAYTLAAMPNETTLAQSSPAQPGTDWEQVSMWAYGLIALGLLVRLAIQTRNLLQVIRRSPVRVHDDYALVEPNNPDIPTFSFFQYVVMNPVDAHNDLILRHELVHVRQWHSVDVLGLAIIRSVVWACPALWLIERALRQVHEFLADRAINQPSEYARILVGYAFGIRPDTLANGFFNPSLLKQRIQMLHQRTTSRWALGKYALILPLALSLLAMTTARKEIETAIDQTNIEGVTISGRVTNAVDGKPLPNATIVVKGTMTGTTTNVDGKYRIRVPVDGTLTFSFVGFAEQEVNIGKQTVINVTLARKTNELTDIVAIAHEQGVSSRHDSTIKRATKVFTVVEQQPEFPGGMAALSRHLSGNLRYPDDARRANQTGYVFVKFVVSEKGDIQQLRVTKGIGFGCDEEAVRVVSLMPKWNPGKQNGVPVSVQYVLPIQFVLEKKEDKRTGQLKSTPDPSGNSVSAFLATQSDTLPNQPSTNSSRVTIRGRGPLGELGAQPLYIIDGVQQVSKEGQPGPIDGLNPNTIESVTVLKDASSTAMYGDKGKNGVVLITTKKKSEAPVEKP